MSKRAHVEEAPPAPAPASPSPSSSLVDEGMSPPPSKVARVGGGEAAPAPAGAAATSGWSASHDDAATIIKAFDDAVGCVGRVLSPQLARRLSQWVAQEDVAQWHEWPELLRALDDRRLFLRSPLSGNLALWTQFFANRTLDKEFRDMANFGVMVFLAVAVNASSARVNVAKDVAAVLRDPDLDLVFYDARVEAVVAHVLGHNVSLFSLKPGEDESFLMFNFKYDTSFFVEQYFFDHHRTITVDY